MATRTSIQAHSAGVNEGPAFEISTEDGPASTWRLFVDCTVAGVVYTHVHSFARSQAEAAQRLADRVNALGTVDLAHWSRGDCWASVHEGLTLEERLGDYGREFMREHADRHGDK